MFKDRDSYKWVVLAISFILMVTFAISLQSLPPIFEQIGKDIPFSNSQAGMLMGAYAVPGILLPFLIAALANRFNEKSIILVALLTLIIGLVLFSLSQSFATLLIFRVIAGIGATALVVLAPLLVTKFFDQDNIGIAMGIFNAAVPFGTVIATNLFGIFGGRMEWRSLILSIAIFAGLVLAISFFLLSIPEDSDDSQVEGRSRESLSGLWSNPRLWLLSSIWALANGQLLSYVTFGPQYFQGIGMSVQKSGLLTSLIMLIPIFFSPIVGMIVDKTGWKKRLLLIGSTLMLITFVLITKILPALPLWAVVLGIGFSPIPVLIFALLPEMVQPEQVGMGLGVLTSASNVGIAMGPWAFGLFLDGTGGNFSLGFIILALISLVIIGITTALNTRTDVI